MDCRSWVSTCLGLNESKQKAMVAVLAPRVTRSVFSKGPRFLTRALWVAGLLRNPAPVRWLCPQYAKERERPHGWSGVPPLTESSRNCELARLMQQTGVAPVPHGTWNVPRSTRAWLAASADQPGNASAHQGSQTPSLAFLSHSKASACSCLDPSASKRVLELFCWWPGGSVAFTAWTVLCRRCFPTPDGSGVRDLAPPSAQRWW